MNTPYTNPSTIVDVTDDKPKRVAPVPEDYAGWNNPYRGTNHHGVDIENPYQEPLIQTTDDVEEYEHTAPAAPIPVTLVAPPDTRTRARITSTPVQPGTVVQVLGNDTFRKYARFVVRPNKDLYGARIILSDSVSLGDSYYLEPGNTFETWSNDAFSIYHDDPNNSVTVDIYVESYTNETLVR